MFTDAGLKVMGWLQINIRPLWTVPSRVVFVVISITGSLYDGSLGVSHDQRAASV